MNKLLIELFHTILVTAFAAFLVACNDNGVPAKPAGHTQTDYERSSVTRTERSDPPPALAARRRTRHGERDRYWHLDALRSPSL